MSSLIKPVIGGGGGVGGTAVDPVGPGGVMIDPSEITGPTVPTAHKDTHKSGGSDAFVSVDLLEAVVKRLRESSGPTDLTVGAVANGQLLRRTGTGLVGVEAASESPEWVGIGKIITMTNLDTIWTAPFNGKIRAVALARRIAGSAGFTRVDVNRNLGTIFTTAANRPSITAASGNDQAVITTLMDLTTFTQGDHFTVDVDDAESGSPRDVRVLMVVEYD